MTSMITKFNKFRLAALDLFPCRNVFEAEEQIYVVKPRLSFSGGKGKVYGVSNLVMSRQCISVSTKKLKGGRSTLDDVNHGRHHKDYTVRIKDLDKLG